MHRAAVVLLVALVSVPRIGWGQAGVPVGPEFLVNTYTFDWQQRPSVASDPESTFVVVWDGESQDGDGHGVFAQRYLISGLPLGPEFRVNTYTTGFQAGPSVAVIAGGEFVVVWGSQQDGSDDVFGQRYNSSGAPVGPEFRVNTHTSFGQWQGRVAADAFGNFVVVWTSNGQDGANSGVFGQRFASTGVPLGAEFRVNTYTSGYQTSPAVASDLQGNFIVVWQDGLTGGGLPGRGVFGQRYDSSGAPVGPEFQVETYTTGFQGGPSVAVDFSGDFVVVWHSDLQDGYLWGVFGQRYSSSGAPVGSDFRVNTFTFGYQWGPAVASDGSGNFVVTWGSIGQDGSNSGIFGQRYDSAGVPQGSEFRVNTYTTLDQGGAAVATNGGGSFVVVWTSGGQDGSGTGIFGQRFNQIVPVELMQFGVE
jgi:hypothetical protein